MDIAPVVIVISIFIVLYVVARLLGQDAPHSTRETLDDVPVERCPRCAHAISYSIDGITHRDSQRDAAGKDVCPHCGGRITR